MSPGKGLGPVVLAVMWFETGLAITFTAVRFWSRGKLANVSFGLDDHLLWITSVNFIIFSILTSVSVHYGMGNHKSTLNQEQFVTSNMWEIIGEVFGTIALCTSKAAVGAFLLRIVVAKSHRIIIWTLLGVITIVSSLTIIFLFATCKPVEANWNPFIPSVCHLDLAPYLITYVSVSAAVDFILAACPWFFLRKLQMKQRDRIAINSSLSLGIVSGIFAVVRAQKVSSLTAKSDYTFVTVQVILWSSSELCVSAICICVPSIRLIYKHYVGGSSSDPNSGSRGYRLEDMSKAGGNDVYTVRVGHQTLSSNKSGTLQNNSSDESILGQDFRREGIKMTREIDVQYETHGTTDNSRA